MNKLRIESEIAEAETLPTEFYLDDAYFEASKERIFSKTWQFAGLRTRSERLSPTFLLDGFLDEPLLIVNGDSSKCFQNVCTHRGNILVNECIESDGIRCGYHGRRFDLNGKCVSMSEFEGVLNFPSSKDDLTAVEMAVWSELMFVALNPIADFASFVAPINALFGDFGQTAKLKIETAGFEVNAHWALYCENYLEGFHIPYVHPGLNKELDFGAYKTETSRYSVLQTGFGATDVEAGSGGPFSEGAAAYYYFVFPNLMFNFYPWGLSFNVVEPVNKSFTRIKYVSLIIDESTRNSGAGGELEQVEAEDQKVVESVQKGIRSRFYDRGRYSVKREQGVHHFHRLIAEFMNGKEV